MPLGEKLPAGHPVLRSHGCPYVQLSAPPTPPARRPRRRDTHAVGGGGQQLAHQVPVRPFSISLIRAILSSVIVVSCSRFSSQPNPSRRPAMTISAVIGSYTTRWNATRRTNRHRPGTWACSAWAEDYNTERPHPSLGSRFRWRTPPSSGSRLCSRSQPSPTTATRPAGLWPPLDEDRGSDHGRALATISLSDFKTITARRRSSRSALRMQWQSYRSKE